MNKYFKLRRYPAHLIYLFNKHLLGQVESVLRCKNQNELQHPPVFIIGPPRSGSTLAIQVITDSFNFGYISNRHCRWFGAPALAELVFKPTKSKPNSNYRSKYGTTEGHFAPAECGNWWYRFFRKTPPYVTLDDVNPDKMRRFRQSIVALTNSFNRPVIFKNLYASLRIQAIAHIIPESLFIVMHRDEIDNGHSLLEARFKRFQNYEAWFSLELPHAGYLKRRPPHEQVIEQIRQTHTLINEDMKRSGIRPNRRFDLSYEKLCSDPAKVINDLSSFFSENNCNISKRASPPPSFSIKTSIRIDQALYERMVNYSAKCPR